MASTNALALLEIDAQSFFASASFVTRADPTPTTAAPALIHSPQFFRSTPPVGVSFNWGRGARMSLKNCGPRAVLGKTLITSPPRVQARMISVGVKAPGTLILAYFTVVAITSGSVNGETTNCAP